MKLKTMTSKGGQIVYFSFRQFDIFLTNTKNDIIYGHMLDVTNNIINFRLTRDRITNLSNFSKYSKIPYITFTLINSYSNLSYQIMSQFDEFKKIARTNKKLLK